MRYLSDAEVSDLADVHRRVYSALAEAVRVKFADLLDPNCGGFWIEEDETTDHPIPLILWFDLRFMEPSWLPLYGGSDDSPRAFSVWPKLKTPRLRWDITGAGKTDDEFVAEVRQFIRDWVTGEMSCVVRYAGNAPIETRLVRGTQTLARRQALTLGFWRKRSERVYRIEAGDRRDSL